MIHTQRLTDTTCEVTITCRKECGRSIRFESIVGDVLVDAPLIAAERVRRDDGWGDDMGCNICRQCKLNEAGWQSFPGPAQEGGR